MYFKTGLGVCQFFVCGGVLPMCCGGLYSGEGHL